MPQKLIPNALFNRFLAVTVVPAALAAAMLVGSVEPAHAKSCKPNAVNATAGTSITNVGARTKARLGWNAVVASKHGVGWASWALSSGKTYTCKKKGINWRCTASSKPCKL